MAGPYRAVLKQVADGVSPEDIEKMTYNLGFTTAKRASIKNGVQLLQEMENQDLIAEDDLNQLKQLLDNHELKKLGKVVGCFMEKESKAAKSEEEVPIQKTDAAGSFTTAQQPVPSPGPNMVAPPGGFPGNQYNSYASSPPTVYGMPGVCQQGYNPMVNQQQIPMTHYAANLSLGPNPQNPSMSMMQMPQQNQYFFPQNHPGINQNMVANGSYHGNQQASQMHVMPNQYQPPSMLPHNGTHNTILPPHQGMVHHQNNQSQIPNPGINHQSTRTPPNIPTYTSRSNRLEIQSSEENNQSDEGEVVADTPIGMLQKLNLEDSCGSLKSVEPIAKIKDQGPVGHSHNATQGEMPSLKRESHRNDTPLEVDGKVVNRLPENCPTQGTAVQPSSTVSGFRAQQPASAVHGVHRVRPSPAFTRWKQDGKKVPIFQQGGYELKIMTEPTHAEHYETGEGRYVLMPWESTYKIYIGNNTSLGCATEVTYDGMWAGEFELRSGEHMVIERPTIEEKKFCFVKPESAPPGSGVRVDNPENGVIIANFLPEIRPELNDLKRGGSSGHLEVDDPFCHDRGCDEIYDDSEVVSDAMAYSTAYNPHVQQNDVQRSITGSALSTDLKTGATALVGHSNQQFQPADYFQVDDTKKVEIKLKLVGLK